MSEGGGAARPEPDIKCVVWDLDGTLLTGVLLEAAPDTPPVPRPGVRAALAQLHRRGILNSIASHNPPALAAAAVRAVDWPAPFLAPQYGWGEKPVALRRIADTLHIDPAAIAFVDDDPYQRAAVAAALPPVLVLSPEVVTAALRWPRFRPEVVTAQGRARAASYLAAQRREQAQSTFTGAPEEFRRYCQTAVTLRPATAADLPRLRELSVRTSRFNSRGRAVSEWELATRLGAAGHLVVCVDLRDRFSDDGTVGGAVLAIGPDRWRADLVMMSCRATGRGVIDAMLGALLRAATAAGTGRIEVPVQANDRNLPLRLALRAAGFRAGRPAPWPAGGVAPPEVRLAGAGGPPGATAAVEFARPVPGAAPRSPAGIEVVDALCCS